MESLALSEKQEGGERSKVSESSTSRGREEGKEEETTKLTFQVSRQGSIQQSEVRVGDAILFVLVLVVVLVLLRRSQRSSPRSSWSEIPGRRRNSKEALQCSRIFITVVDTSFD